jgi:SAM-dependent methyltransferase
VTRLDDPALVAREYADETRLRRRAAAFTGQATGEDARVSLVAAVSAVRPRRVLEVGCGWGELAVWIGRDTEAEVVAIDLSPRMVELARSRGVDARVADVQDLPFADASFDVAVAAWMLYHVPDLDRGLAELRRVLAPGGRLVAVVNGAPHLQELRELFGRRFESTITRENGAALLGRHFARVDRRDVDGWTSIPDREAVLAYVDSGFSTRGAEPPEFDVPFRVRYAATVFVATK